MPIRISKKRRNEYWERYVYDSKSQDELTGQERRLVREIVSEMWRTLDSQPTKALRKMRRTVPKLNSASSVIRPSLPNTPLWTTEWPKCRPVNRRCDIRRR